MATVRGKRRSGRVQIGWFFTDERVKKAVAAALRKALWKAGANIREEARRGIKKKGKARATSFSEATKSAKAGMGVIRAARKWEAEVIRRPASPAGSPPYTHTGFLRDDIVYAFDPNTMSVVCGPYREPWLNALHERGGSQMRWKVKSTSTGRTFMTKREPKLHGVLARLPVSKQRYRVLGRKAAQYPARPYMKPGLNAALRKNKITGALANSVK